MNNKIKLNRNVEIALNGSWASSGYRTCAEKKFAHALIVGGVTKVCLSTSYWCTCPPNADGLLVNKRSIVTYFKPSEERPILWQILDYLNIPFSGGADRYKGFAQASWLVPLREDQEKNVCVYFKNFDLAMTVIYFNELYQFKKEECQLLF